MHLPRPFFVPVLILGASLLLAACREASPPESSSPAEPTEASAASDAPISLVVVTIDTLRADHLGCYGYPRDTSPFIDELAAKGVVFENAIASSATTVPSHASIMTGLYPAQHGLIRNGAPLDASHYTLAQLFQSNDYQTAAFTSAGFLKPLRSGFGFFDINRRRRGQATVKSVEDWLDRTQPDRQRGLFLWVHLFDPHEPFESSETDFYQELESLPEEQKRRFEEYVFQQRRVPLDHFRSRELLHYKFNNYDADIRYTDNQVQRLFQVLDESGFGGNTLWIVTADHGQGMGSHRLTGHGRFLYNEQVRIPLIFYWTGDRLEPRRLENLVRHVDLLPTLAELAGFDLAEQQPSVPFAGSSLMPLLLGGAGSDSIRYAYAQRVPRDDKKHQKDWEDGEVYSLQSLEHKYIFRSQDPDEFYDLVRDPLELVNAIDSHEAAAARDRLRGALEERRARWALEAREAGSAEIQPEYLDELKALGYIAP